MVKNLIIPYKFETAKLLKNRNIHKLFFKIYFMVVCTTNDSSKLKLTFYLFDGNAEQFFGNRIQILFFACKMKNSMPVRQ